MKKEYELKWGAFAEVLQSVFNMKLELKFIPQVTMKNK